MYICTFPDGIVTGERGVKEREESHLREEERKMRRVKKGKRTTEMHWCEMAYFHFLVGFPLLSKR